MDVEDRIGGDVGPRMGRNAAFRTYIPIEQYDTIREYESELVRFSPYDEQVPSACDSIHALKLYTQEGSLWIERRGISDIIVAPAIPSLPSKLHEANRLIETWNLGKSMRNLSDTIGIEFAHRRSASFTQCYDVSREQQHCLERKYIMLSLTYVLRVHFIYRFACINNFTFLFCSALMEYYILYSK